MDNELAVKIKGLNEKIEGLRRRKTEAVIRVETAEREKKELDEELRRMGVDPEKLDAVLEEEEKELHRKVGETEKLVEITEKELLVIEQAQRN